MACDLLRSNLVRSTALAALGVALLGLAPGCSCSQRALPGADLDGAVPDSAAFDAGQPRDVGADGRLPADAGHDGGACTTPATWTLVTRVVSSVTLIDALPPRRGSTERLRVTVGLNAGCEELATVAVSPVGVGACCVDVWSIAASVWALSPCPGGERGAASWNISLDGRGQGNPNLMILDGHQAGATLLQYARESCPAAPDCGCRYDSPPGAGAAGATCESDCDCAAGLACVSYAGFAGPLRSCERPCNGFLDCGAMQTCYESIGDGPAWTCAEGDQCGGGVDCPPGFQCLLAQSDSACRDRRLVPAPDTACACDADCPIGSRCAAVGAGAASCAIPCRDERDCPAEAGLTCGAGPVCFVGDD